MESKEISSSLSEKIKAYKIRLEELKLCESQIDFLEDYFLQTYSHGNYYFPSILELGTEDFKRVEVPPHCKLFSLSSLTSTAFSELSKPYQGIGL